MPKPTVVLSKRWHLDSWVIVLSQVQIVYREAGASHDHLVLISKMFKRYPDEYLKLARYYCNVEVVD